MLLTNAVSLIAAYRRGGVVQTESNLRGDHFIPIST